MAKILSEKKNRRMQKDIYQETGYKYHIWRFGAVGRFRKGEKFAPTFNGECGMKKKDDSSDSFCIATDGKYCTCRLEIDICPVDFFYGAKSIRTYRLVTA